MDVIREKDRKIEENEGVIEELEGKIRVMKEEKVLQSELEGQIEGLQRDLTENRMREDQLRQSKSALLQDLQAHKDDLERRSSLYLQDKQRLNEQLTALTKALESKTQECLCLQKDLMDARNSITTLEQLCCDAADLQEMHEEAVKQSRTYQVSQDHLSLELQFLSDYLLSTSTHRLQLSQAAHTLSQHLHTKEDEIDSLKEVISKLKKRMVVYVPVKVRTR